MLKPHRIMTEAGFTSSLTAEAVDRFRKAAVAWSWIAENGFFSVHFLLRPTQPSKSISGGKELGYTVSRLQGAAELTAAYQSGDSTQIGADLEMAVAQKALRGQESGSDSAWIWWSSGSLLLARIDLQQLQVGLDWG